MTINKTFNEMSLSINKHMLQLKLFPRKNSNARVTRLSDVRTSKIAIYCRYSTFIIGVENQKLKVVYVEVSADDAYM